MKTKQTIEINGTQYDAVSGQAVGSVKPPHVRPLATSRNHQGKTVDGVFRTAGQPVAAAVKSPASKTIRTVTVNRPKSANHTKPHRTQCPQTLMRRAVQPPSFGLKKQLNTQGELQTTKPELAAVTSKLSASTISPSRQARAASVGKSQHISRYASDQPALAVPVTVAPIHVQTAPEQLLPASASATTHRPLDIFEQAMQNATHYRPIPDHKAFKRKTRRHLSTIAAGGMALLVLGGFVTYLNTPALQFRAASLQAGVGASVPRLDSSGLLLTGASHSGNIVHASFSGSKGSGSYTLSEQSTGWDNADMIAQVGTTDPSGTPTYKTLNAGGQSVYRFSNTTATWVKNGIWYQLTSPQAVSDDQVKTIAANL